MTNASRIGTKVCGLTFQNPIILAAGTAGYGRELAGVMDLDAIGGLVTKAVSREPRPGAPAPRVAEFPGGMINAVGLANPGMAAVVDHELPWLGSHLPRTRKIVNIVGFTVDEFPAVVGGLEEAAARPGSLVDGGIDALELNVSCPNTKAGGLEFGADPSALRAVVSGVRTRTKRPVFVKLSPTLPDIASAARIAADAGADGLTLVNTIPGLLVDVERRRPALGFGTGGVSGPGLVPVGVLATWKVSRAVSLPIIGLGGVRTASDALQYMVAGAALVGVGTAALKDPSQPARIVRDLAEWCEDRGIASIAEVVGTLQWPA